MKIKVDLDQPDIVEVFWRDTTSHSAWHSNPQNFRTMRVRSCGYLTGLTKKHVWISQSCTGDPVYGDTTVIPRCLVENIVRVGRSKVRLLQ